MKNLKRVTVCVVILFITGLLAGYGPAIGAKSTDLPTRMVPVNFSALAEEVRPGVVNIRTVRTVKGGDQVSHFFRGNPFDGKNPFEDLFGPFFKGDKNPYHKQKGLGSGFIIDREGYIITNNHVIENADQITVKLADGEEYDATLVGRDSKTDLAVIKIEPPSDITPLKMGNSDALKVGGWVVAVGSPFGLEQTVTAGIVSAKGRVIGSGPYDDFIQTDASINPGNSGGPLINMEGEVVGINTAIIAGGHGIGFAIPINLARGIVTQLKSRGEVTRAWLGVGIQDLTTELEEYYKTGDRKGVIVTEVYKDSPADKGGIETEDIILAADGKKVSSGRELSRTVANLPVGKRVAISILRKGTEKTVHVKMAKRTDDASQVKHEMDRYGELGLKAANMSPELANRFGYDGDEKGVIVLEVETDSSAKRAGIRPGDLIRSVNHTTVTMVKEYRAQVDKVKKGGAIQLLIKRQNAGFMAVRITK